MSALPPVPTPQKPQHSMTPTELAQAARALVESPDPTTRGLWARSAALLARQALEMHLNALLDALAPGAQHARFRARFVALEGLHHDQALARQMAYTWAMLSSATHHFAYELPPTAAELTTWLDAVDAFVATE